MAQLFETTILLDPQETGRRYTCGLQVLVGPARVGGVEVEYTTLLGEIEEADAHAIDVRGEPQVMLALASLSDPTDGGRSVMALTEFAVMDWRLPLNGLNPRVLEFLYREPLIAIERSPLTKDSLAQLILGAELARVVVIGGEPSLLVIGGTTGFIVLRSLGARAGAFWRGADPEIEEFGKDSARTVLDAVRGRLGIERIRRDD